MPPGPAAQPRATRAPGRPTPAHRPARRSTSAASSPGVAYRSCGRNAIALRQTASRAQGDLRLDLAWRDDPPPPDRVQHLGRVAPLDRGAAGQQPVERRAQAVDVAGRAQLVDAALGLLGAHVRRRADGRAHASRLVPGPRGRPQGRLPRARLGLLPPTDRLGQPPVHDQGLTVGPEHDVARLEVAVQHAARMRIRHGVAHVHEAAEQPAQGQRTLGGIPTRRVLAMESLDGFPETVAADEPHRVERPAVVEVSEPVDRHDPRMLQAPGHLGFHQEPGAALGGIGMLGLDPLRAPPPGGAPRRARRGPRRAPPRMRPQDAEPPMARLLRSPGEARCAIGIGGRDRLRRQPRQAPGQPVNAVGHVRVGDGRQVAPDPSGRAQRREAPPGIPVVPLQVLSHQGLQQLTLVLGQVPPLRQDLAQRLRLVQRQAFMAAIRASREMKSICSATMPKSRLRSAACWDICALLPDVPAPTPTPRGFRSTSSRSGPRRRR